MKASKIIPEIQALFPGFTKNQYKTAIEYANPLLYKSQKKIIINVPFFPYIERIGPTEHSFFMKTITDYLYHKSHIKPYNHRNL